MSKQSSDFEADIGKKYAVGKLTVQIEGVVAEGGFGVVFLARNSTSQRYALKRLYVNEEATLNACKREIQIMSSLSSHKNMVTFVDSAINRNYKGVWEVLILMQYYPGSCMKIMNDRSSVGLKEPEILRIFCDICEAVSRLHHCQTPILHRDLKIENILCDSSGTCVLCDFGSATARIYVPGKDERSVTEVEEDINKHTTLSHRSPEMVNLYGHKSITTKADIWALGVTLYRLCFRTLPFGESTLAIQTANINIPETSPYSPGLHALIWYCLEADPDIRPDIFQVSYLSFLLANRECPVKNINKAEVPDVNKLAESMFSKTSKNSLSSTPRNQDRSSRLEKTTTITPRERPKAARTASHQVSSNLTAPPAQRKLLPDGAVSQAPASGLQSASYTVEQQQYLLQQQQHLYHMQQQQLAQQQHAQQQHAQQQQLEQQHLAQLQLAQQQLAEQQYLQQQYMAIQQQQQLALRQQYELQSPYSQQQSQSDTSSQQQQLEQQRALEEQYKWQQLAAQYQLQQHYQLQLQHNLQQPALPDSTPEENAFEDDFSRVNLFEADFSQANFTAHTSQDVAEASQPTPAFSEETPANLTTSSNSAVVVAPHIERVVAESPPTDQGLSEDFKLPLVSKTVKQNSSLKDGQLTPPLSKSKKSHRRNASDTSAISIGTGNSAFRAYNKSAKPLTSSLGSLSSANNSITLPESSILRSKSEADSLADGTRTSQTVKSASVEALNQNWNPFADDADSISDDVMFGQEFDRLRCGSQSSIQNVKSREDLVMLEGGSSSSLDPFEAAPFNPRSLRGRQWRKEQKLAEKYSRLSAATSDDNLLEVEIPAKVSNQTIFGVPIPFTRKMDRGDKYRKVQTDSSDTDSLCNNRDGDRSEEDDLLPRSVQYERMDDSSNSSNSGTLTRSGQLELTLNGDSQRPESADSNYSSTVTPTASSSENITETFSSQCISQYPVPLLPTNPFLSDILCQGHVKVETHSEESSKGVEVETSSRGGGDAVNTLERTREPSFSDFATMRNSNQPPASPGSSEFSSAAPPGGSVDSLSNSSRLQKSRTLDSIKTLSSADKSLHGLSSQEILPLRRSLTDYQVVSADVEGKESVADDLSDSDTLLADRCSSLKKKDKGRKSPKTSKQNKSVRSTDTKKSYAEVPASEISQTNEAFSEQDTTPEAADSTQKPFAPPKPVTKSVPPVAPKPLVGVKVPPPVAVKPKFKSKSVYEPASRSGAASTPVKATASVEVRVQSKSEVKAPAPAVTKDAYKTHKRYSSYDLATGRAELSLCSEDSKSSLVGKEGKSKKKNKIGLGIF